MSYRSDVMAVITPKTKKTFEKYLSELKNDELLASIVKCGELKVNEETYVIQLYWGYIKWYEESFEEVMHFMKWLREKPNYHYIRFGEEHDDVEEEYIGDPEYYIYLHRHLSGPLDE